MTYFCDLLLGGNGNFVGFWKTDSRQTNKDFESLEVFNKMIECSSPKMNESSRTVFKRSNIFKSLESFDHREKLPTILLKYNPHVIYEVDWQRNLEKNLSSFLNLNIILEIL